ncbi:Protein of unknown function DUF812 [Carpediemonas membranifera]|uniref:CCDC22 N-terminal domain-containing protein n=1 Tax=Carpediemonas membranifera TaxID=201153 RepID=A0A8J6DZ31_9EUKA|nr:Protein of unknown function DUF812 [Carpediemonas membranifera]|eukprot:KAG9390173.1 Protein of unknown function DUF812 [Carpediemonas membranifera]
MAESEVHIVRALQQVGCEVPEDMTLASFDAAMLRSAIYVCLEKIKPEIKLPAQITDDSLASVKFRVTQQLVDIIKGCGFIGELGYNQLLYPSAKDTRGVLAWLVERLPRQTTTTTLSKAELFRADIQAALKTWTQPRLPLCLRRSQLPTPFEAVTLKMSKPMSQQVTPDTMLPSIIESTRVFSQKKKTVSSKATAERLQDFRKIIMDGLNGVVGAEVPEEPAAEQVTGELSRLEQMAMYQHEDAVIETTDTDGDLSKADVDTLVAMSGDLKSRRADLAATALAAENKRSAFADEIETAEKSIAEQARALEKLAVAQEMAADPDVDEKLDAQEAKVSGKLERMQSEWKEAKDALISDLAAVQQSIDTMDSELEATAEQAKERKAEARTLLETLRQKEAAMEQAAGGTNVRESIIESIRDLRRSVAKQLAELDSVKVEVRERKIEYDAAAEKSAASYAAVKEAMSRPGKAADKQAFAELARSRLNKVHGVFKHLERLTENIAATEQKIVETERLAATEGQAAGEVPVESVARDLEALRAENKALMEQLKARQE